MQKERAEELLNKINDELIIINAQIGKLNDAEFEINKNIKEQKKLATKKDYALNDLAGLSFINLAILSPSIFFSSFFGTLAGINFSKSIIKRVQNKKCEKAKEELFKNEIQLAQTGRMRSHLSFRRFCLMEERERVKEGKEPLIII